MAKRGRPRKPIDQGPLKYQLYRSEEVEEKNGILMRMGKGANDYSFHTKDDLVNSMKKLLIYNRNAFPLGLVLRDFGYYDTQYIESCLYNFLIDPETCVTNAGMRISTAFEEEMIEYNKSLAMKNTIDLGFHLYMIINLRMFGNNLSVIERIINETHYKFFRDYPACYIFVTPDQYHDPKCYLHIYVSNFSAKRHSYLSSHLLYGLDAMGIDTRVLVNRIADHYTSNGTRNYHVDPFSVDPKSITPLPDTKIPSKYLSYRDWYNAIFRDDKDVIISKNAKYKPLIRG